MQTKTQLDELQNYLTDASNLQGGHTEKLFIPETTEEISEILREANKEKIFVTISGARTGLVGGAVPFGGWIISLEKINKLKSIEKTETGGTAIVEAGILLTEFQKETESRGLFYPPDPTEWSCQIGGTVATNASGSRSFKYGATRNFVERLRVVLPSGEIAELRRGENLSKDGFVEIETVTHRKIVLKLPTYSQPDVRKNTSGYFAGEKIDAIDLFIGSEGTLGVIVEIELKLLPKPQGFLSGIVFFKENRDLLNFVNEVRKISFETRRTQYPNSRIANQIDAALLEYFDEESLKFIREKFAEVPENMAGAIYFEQETIEENEETLFEQWNDLLENYNANLDVSWFTTTERDRQKLRDFRHALPVAVNERIVKYKQRKISTDIAVPDENFPSLLRFYKESLKKSGFEYVIFGHIGDNHLHVNILPKTDEESVRAKQLYGRFIAQGIMLGGTVSAEHGIGKIKSKYLYAAMGERYLNEMAELKKTLDPNAILGRGNIFDSKFMN